FAVAIRNPNTRKAYYRAAQAFFEWASGLGLSLPDIRPIHIAGWIELQKQTYSTASVKQQLAGLKMLFDWLVTGHIIDVNPAQSVRSPRHVVRKGKTPVLAADEARHLLASIDTSTIVGLRDRALIGTMIYSFA